MRTREAAVPRNHERSSTGRHGGHRALAMVLSALLLLVTSKPSAAVQNDGGAWIVVVAQGDFGDVSPKLENLLYWFDPQVRFLGDSDGLSQALLRPALGWRIFESGEIHAGYTWLHSETPRGRSLTEHQAWQQFTWSEPSGSFTRQWRTRLEQRFLTTSDDVGVRLRQMFRTTIPIRKGSSISVAASDEVFFHLRDTDWGQQAGFDENRFFIGLDWKYAAKVGATFELGYMNRYVEIPGVPNRLEHLALATFYFNN